MRNRKNIVTKDMLKTASKTIISENKTLNHIMSNVKVKEETVLNNSYEQCKFELFKQIG